ncbi:MAG: vWA domain-containing protein [Kofleriaceae bacterium]
MKSLLFATSASLLAAGCSDQIVVGGLQEVASMKAIPNRDLDILFVIDNSGSMADKQASLAANFPRMIDVLEQLDDGLPNVHIGVVTSDLGTLTSSSPTPGPNIATCTSVGNDGVLQTNGSTSLTGSFISDIGQPDGSRTRNYTGALRDVFTEIARVGEQGCGFEQHLAAMRRALTHPANAGFLRPEANLAVIIIADEDDCSALSPSLFTHESPALGPLDSYRCFQFGVTCDPGVTTTGTKSSCAPNEESPLVEGVQPFIDALIDAKGDARKVMVAAIAGAPGPVEVELSPPAGGGAPRLSVTPSCAYAGLSTPQLTADPAIRLASFVDAFPGRSELATICSSDLSGPLVAIGETTKKLVGDPCLDASRLVDTSPEPGTQPACEALDVRDSTPAHARTLPTCATASDTDCIEIVPDAAACPSQDEHLRVRFHRTSAVADDTWTSVRCQVRA